MQISIIGATGVVGREVIELVSRAWPDATLTLFASRDQQLETPTGTYPVQAAKRLEDDDAKGGDLAFVALDDEYSKRYVPRLLQLGYRVVDKSNVYRADPNVPLCVGGVNHDLVTNEVRLAANPNCTTVPLALAIEPLKSIGLESAIVSSYQAISGAGAAKLDEFVEASSVGYAEPDRLGRQFDPNAYAANTVPHNSGTDETGFSSEERKLAYEAPRILRLDGFRVSAQCCRVPVAVGHYENIWLRLNDEVSLSDIESILADPERSPFVHYVPGASGQGMSALASLRERDKALVGRLRMESGGAAGRTVCMTVIGDNLRLGAATNAVRIATQWFPASEPI